MKKRIMLAAVCALCLGLSACGEKEAAVLPESKTIQESTVAETESETADVVEASKETKVMEGMVVEATMNSLQVLTQDGEYFYFIYPEEGVENDRDGGILLGDVIKVTYTGSAENGDAVASKVEDSSIVETLSVGTYEYAISITTMIKFMDLEGLAGLITEYPIYVETADGGKEVESKEDFIALGRENVFTEDLMTLGEYNFFDMTSSKAGIVLGDTTPNVIFKDNGENTFTITGINAIAK